jgi:integrase/recombinase XerD
MTPAAFKQHLRRLGYKKTTVNMLPKCLSDFLTHVNKPVHQIQTEDILTFRNHLKNRPNKRRTGGLSESYIHHHIYAIRLYFKWLQESGALQCNPAAVIQSKSPASEPRKILSKSEIKKLYKATETQKERAVLSIYYGCGLRRSEGQNLDLKDIRFRENLLYVRAGKFNKRRAVPLAENVKKDLLNYALEERQGESPSFFISQINRMSGSALNHTLKRLLNRANLSEEISLHCLRHSIATHLLENGLSVDYVRDFLGHKHLESTQIYTRIKSSQLHDF